MSASVVAKPARLAEWRWSAWSAIADARLVVGILTLVAAALRLTALGHKPLWYDEAVMWLIARRAGQAAVLSANAHSNSAPLLFAAILHEVLHLGSSPELLRLVPVLASIATIPAMYLLSVTLYPNRYAGFLAAGMMALAPHQIEYAQQMREYSLAVLLTIAALMATGHVVTKPTYRGVVILVVLETISILTQYGLLIVVAVAVPLAGLALWRSANHRLLGSLVVLQVLPACATAIDVITTARYQIRPGGFAADSYLATGYWQGHSLHSLAALAIGHTYHLVGFSLTDGMITTVLGAIFVMVVLATAWHALERRWIILLLLGPFALTFALALVDVYPYSSTRQDIYLTVPMVLLVAWGITAAWSFHIVSPKHLPLQAALIALVAVVGLLYPLARDTRNYLRSPGDEVITKALAALKRNQRAQDLVYVAIDAVPAYIYYTCHAASCASALLAVGDKFAMDRILPSTTIGPVIIGQAPHGAPADNRYLPAQVRSLARRGRRVWFLFSHTDVVALTRILTLVHTYGSTVRYVVAPGSSLYLFTPSVTR